MPNISHRIRLFNESYRLAWQLLTVNGEKTAPSDLAVRLSDNIRALITAGYDDVDEIVAEVVRRMN